jgi:hypothetical protein
LFFQQVRAGLAGLLAVEMEAAGVGMSLARLRSEGHNVSFIMVRGISDLSEQPSAQELPEARTTQRDLWKPFAAASAAAYIEYLLTSKGPMRRDDSRFGGRKDGPSIQIGFLETSPTNLPNKKELSEETLAAMKEKRLPQTLEAGVLWREGSDFSDFIAVRIAFWNTGARDARSSSIMISLEDPSIRLLVPLDPANELSPRRLVTPTEWPLMQEGITIRVDQFHSWTAYLLAPRGTQEITFTVHAQAKNSSPTRANLTVRLHDTSWMA